MKRISFSLLIYLFMPYTIGQKNNSTKYGSVIDLNLFESVINPALCTKQINYLLHDNTLLLAEFLDAGIRLPKGILTGNVIDLGNYYQCLNIREKSNNFTIDGKYCLIEVPMDQSELKIPSFLPMPEMPDLRNKFTSLVKKNKKSRLVSLLKKFNKYRSGGDKKDNGTLASVIGGLSLTVAVCIPKVCSTQQALDGLSYSMTTATGFKYKDIYCRLPDDKPWLTVDYVALGIFSTIGLLTLLSTAYDVHHTLILEKNPKQANKIYQSFSVYTNTKRLVTYTPVAGSLECLDGIRALAMMWVVIGHSYVLHLLVYMANPLDVYEYSTSLNSVWISSAPITVDTFFVLGGLLLVYTVTNKLTRRNLVRKLHLFYLLRILRMFPLLAVVVLFQASLLNHVADGPSWIIAAGGIEACRQRWWTTMLFIQNYANPMNLCLPHSWYLAIDIQLHLLSPLVLFWILGRKNRTAWVALTVTVLLALIPSSIYNTLMEFPGTTVSLARFEIQQFYMSHYYVNTFTRCSPYVIGMIYGYLLHLYRDKRVVLPQLLVTVLWICAISLLCVIIYASYPMTQLDWDNKTIDAVACSLMKPAWAVAVGWIVFACVQGYGGPVNWLLSLRMWKLPSRLSYAIYIIHYVIITIRYLTSVAPVYFSPGAHFSRFLSDLLLTMVAAFILTVIVDSPCTVLIKYFTGEGVKKPLESVECEPPKAAVELHSSVEAKNNFKYMTHE